jgi:hypothetical protein
MAYRVTRAHQNAILRRDFRIFFVFISTLEIVYTLSSTFSSIIKRSTYNLRAPMTCDVFVLNEKWERWSERKVSKFGSWKRKKKNFSCAAISLNLMRANIWVWWYLMCDGLIADASVALYDLLHTIDRLSRTLTKIARAQRTTFQRRRN